MGPCPAERNCYLVGSGCIGVGVTQEDGASQRRDILFDGHPRKSNDRTLGTHDDAPTPAGRWSERDFGVTGPARGQVESPAPATKAALSVALDRWRSDDLLPPLLGDTLRVVSD